MKNLRRFTLDTLFPACNVLKTPFRNDVARIYLRPDNRVIVQFDGSFRPISIPSGMPLSYTLSIASSALDKWESSIN